MAHVYTADVIASFEKWLVDNWPDSSAVFRPSGSESIRPFSSADPSRWVSAQWVSIEPFQPMRASEDWCSFDLRLQCFTKTNDRLACAALADNIKGLVRGSTVDVKRRTDGTTVVGQLTVNEVGIAPPQVFDDSGVLVSVVDVTGWVIAS